jgi:hypothetical protein
MPVRIDTNQPTNRILILSLVVVIIAIIGRLTRVEFVTLYHFWIAVFGYLLLVVGTLYKI